MAGGAMTPPAFFMPRITSKVHRHCYNNIVLTPLGEFIYWTSCFIVRMSAYVFWRIKYIDRKNIPRKGRVIIASNHISHLDPPLIGVGIPRNVSFIAKIELFKKNLLGWWMRQMGMIGVERGGGGRKALMAALSVLEREGAIIIFPEGTRSYTGRLSKGKSGVAVLALKSGAPIIPASITGSYEAFSRGMKYPKLGRVKVKFGKPIIVNSGDAMTGEIPRELLEELTAKVMIEIQKLLPESMHPLPGEVPEIQMLKAKGAEKENQIPVSGKNYEHTE